MAQQRILDHHRIDIVAATDDQVLGAAGQVQVAVGVQVAQVARVEPAGRQPDAVPAFVRPRRSR